MPLISRPTAALLPAVAALVALSGVPAVDDAAARTADRPTTTRVSGAQAATMARAARAAGCPANQTPTGYVRAENTKAGTTAWKLRRGSGRTKLEGFADRVSATCGQTVRVYVSTTAPSAKVVAYRMGYYNGDGARKVYTSNPFATRRQTGTDVSTITRMVRANWTPSVDLRIDARFVPGSYLLKLVDSRGGQSYIPLTVRDPGSRAPIALMSEPLTWAAYNGWGGASAYRGAGGNPELRSAVVSLDRPYTKGRGAATYFNNEYPLVVKFEQAGLDVNYITDLDIHQQPTVLRNHRGIVLGSHPEYWSKPMMDGFEAARDAGVNLAVFGSNIAYWQVRMAASPLGANRAIVIWKNLDDDPKAAASPATATVRWRDAPVSRPESTLLGQMYECYGVKADLVVDAPAWPFTVPAGTRLPDVVLGEYDRVGLGPGPADANLQILATSPLQCGGKDTVANVTYYTTASGAGVFSAGTLGWVCGIDGSCDAKGARISESTSRVLTETTLRLVSAMADGPLGFRYPSTKSPMPPAPTVAANLPGDVDAGEAAAPMYTGGCPTQTKPFVPRGDLEAAVLDTQVF